MTLSAGWSEDNCAHLTDVEKAAAARWLHLDPSTIVGPPTGVLVGESPGLARTTTFPMFPTTKNGTGGRLLQVSDLTPGQFLGRLMRVNLFTHHAEGWDHGAAKERAKALVEILPKPFRVILVGRRVGLAFGYEVPFCNYEIDGIFYCCIPHPRLNADMYRAAGIRVGVKAALQFAAGFLEVPKETKV